MKLNLLPTSVAKGRNSKLAWLWAGLIAIAGVLLGLFLASSSIANLKAAKDEWSGFRQDAANTVATAAKADEIIGSPLVLQTVKNANFTKAALDHNAKYPDLYDRVLEEVPPFFRVTTLRAAAIDDKNATITMTGTLDSFSRYNDLVVALARIPGATAIGRAGYTPDPLTVPALTEVDQTGRPYRQSRPGPIPDDPLERLAYLQGLASSQTYDNVGNFGSDDPTLPRGARPGSADVTMTFTMPADLRVPDVRASVTTGGAAPAAGAATAGFGGGPPGGIPGGPPGGIPGGPGRPGAAPGAAAGSRAGEEDR